MDNNVLQHRYNMADSNTLAMEPMDCRVRSNFVLLVNEIDYDSVKDQLFQDGILTDKQIEIIDSKQTRHEKNRKLLYFMRGSPKEKYEGLARALHQYQAHLAECIVGSEQNDPDDKIKELSVTPDMCVCNMKDHFDHLVKHIHVDEIQDLLYQHEVLSYEEVEFLMHQPTPAHQNKLLLGMFKSKPNTAYKLLVAALRQGGQEHLADMLCEPVMEDRLQRHRETGIHWELRKCLQQGFFPEEDGVVSFTEIMSHIG